MAEARFLQQYRTSIAGRITFIVFLCASIACVAFVAIPLVLLALQAGGGLGWGLGVLALLTALSGAACAMMSGLRAFGPGERLSITNEGFKYDGLFRVLRVRWGKVESFRLTKGDFIVRLRVTVRSESHDPQELALDVSGLSPGVDEIMRVFSEATGQPLPVDPKKAKKKKPKAEEEGEGEEQAA